MSKRKIEAVSEYFNEALGCMVNGVKVEAKA